MNKRQTFALLGLLTHLPNGLLTQTLHAMDNYCDYLTDNRLFDLDDEHLNLVFKKHSVMDLIRLGIETERTGEFYWSDKYFAVNYYLDKIWTIAENESDTYYKSCGYDWQDILDRLIELFQYSKDFAESLPDEVRKTLSIYYKPANE